MLAIFFFQADFSIYLFVLNINTHFQAFVTFILGINLEFSKCKKNDDLSFVYITKNCEPCITLITRLLKLKFWLTISISIMKHYKHWKRKNKFDQHCDHVPLTLIRWCYIYSLLFLKYQKHGTFSVNHCVKRSLFHFFGDIILSLFCFNFFLKYN